jgi:hypothetical protein
LRITNVSAMELLNFVYMLLVKDADPQAREKINAALEGRVGEGGGIVVDDETLPESLQGKEAPSWWEGDHDPFANQHTIG